MEQTPTKTNRRKESNITPRRCFETPKPTPRRSIYCSLKYIIINLNLKVRYIFDKIFLLTTFVKKYLSKNKS